MLCSHRYEKELLTEHSHLEVSRSACGRLRRYSRRTHARMRAQRGAVRPAGEAHCAHCAPVGTRPLARAHWHAGPTDRSARRSFHAHVCVQSEAQRSTAKQSKAAVCGGQLYNKHNRIFEQTQARPIPRGPTGPAGIDRPASGGTGPPVSAVFPGHDENRADAHRSRRTHPHAHAHSWMCTQARHTHAQEHKHRQHSKLAHAPSRIHLPPLQAIREPLLGSGIARPPTHGPHRRGMGS